MDIAIQLTINSVIAGSIYTLIALGFNLIYGATRFFNLAHGVMATLGGYTTFFLLKTANFDTVSASLIGVIVAGFFGYGLYRVIYDPLLERKASDMVLLVASLGVFTVLQAAIAIIFTAQFHTLSVGSSTIYNFLGATITKTQVIILIITALVSLGLVLLMKFTLFGKVVRAVSDNREVAKIVGLNVRRIIGHVFFIGSAVAGLAGVLVGFDIGIEPNMGLDLLLKGVIAAIIGGVGNIYAAILGGFLLGLVENFGIWKIAGEWQDAIAFGLLLLFLIFRPRGLVNK